MIEFRAVLYVLGRLMLLLAAAMGVPALVDLATGHPDWKVFAAAAALTGFLGGAIEFALRDVEVRLGIREGFLLTALSWMVLSALGALPFAFAGLELDYDDAVFEAVSGLTTTGATVIVGLDQLPPGLLLWRAMLQWYGGIGIIVVAILVLPFLRVGGMQLFHTESSDRSEKAVPRLSALIGAIAVAYLALTALCAIAYGLAGMTTLEAVVHAMTTLSTGGYSTSDASLAHFASPAIEWIAVVFMLAGALPFALYVRAARGDIRPLLRDTQVRGFLGFLVVVCAALTAWLVFERGLAASEAVRLVVVNVVSVVTTTGYATADYGTWGDFPVAVFIVLMMVGGCYGSTSGGIKVFRWQISWLRVRLQLRRLLEPHRVLPMRYEGRPIADDVPGSVTMFISLYIGGVLAFTILLSLCGLDFLAAFSSALTAFGNVGPGLGPEVGPAGNFAGVSDGAKWLMSLAMLAGRLELYAVLLLFTPRFWRR